VTCAECGRDVVQVCHQCWPAKVEKVARAGGCASNVGALELANILLASLSRESIVEGPTSVIDMDSKTERNLWIRIAEDILFGRGLEIRRKK